MKTIIAINSSRRKMNTYNFMKSAEKELNKHNMQLKIINLFDYDLKECNGCEMCVRGKSCPIKDDANNIMQELIDCDGIILSSPVYMAGVTGRLKTFIDRTCSWYHRSPLVGKPIYLMSTTAGGYADEVLSYMEKVSIFWGCQICGKSYRTVRNLKKGVTAKEISPFIQRLNQNKNTYKPKLKQLTTYQLQRVLAKKVLKVDKVFWEEKGWHNQIFYFKCKIPWYKKIVASLFYKLLNSVINPT